jgi:hypothetical protein
MLASQAEVNPAAAAFSAWATTSSTLDPPMLIAIFMCRNVRRVRCLRHRGGTGASPLRSSVICRRPVRAEDEGLAEGFRLAVLVPTGDDVDAGDRGLAGLHQAAGDDGRPCIEARRRSNPPRVAFSPCDIAVDADEIDADLPRTTDPNVVDPLVKAAAMWLPCRTHGLSPLGLMTEDPDAVRIGPVDVEHERQQGRSSSHIRISGRRGSRLVTAVAPLLLAGTFGACGGDDESADETTTTQDETTSTTAPEETTTTEDDDADTTTTAAGTATTIAAEIDEAWRATAVEFRADTPGTEHEFDCPPDGFEDSVWGTDIYTDDSSVCTAAVHAGFITFEDGGTVTISIEGPQESFDASERNGVTSLEYPAWPGSFSVVSAD